jgi:HlyD family secretion protein
MALPRKRIALIVVLLVVVGALVVVGLRLHRAHRASDALTLYGNIDVRTVQLSFNDAGRIDRVSVEEGARVHRGQILAQLEPERFEDAVAQAEGLLGAARERLALLEAGSRPQEIAAARAAVAAAAATRKNARATYERQRGLAARHLVAQQSADDALRALRTADAQLDSARQALSLAVQGPRSEDIAAARQQVKAQAAALALARRRLTDTRLVAPADATVQARILEPGDMASPSVPALTLALTHPVWARVYLPETELGKVRPGMRAQIHSDSFPGKAFPGWVGYISPTAEFTPQTVQTSDLRTQLVYRVRVFACNADGRLRLGMPVTVRLSLHDNPPQADPGRACGP